MDLPDSVLEAIVAYNKKDYAQRVRNIIAWSKALNITPTVDHVSWDQEMWRSNTSIGMLWDSVRNRAKPKEAKDIVFSEPTLLKCPKCNEHQVHISKIIQKRGCDEPATIYACCKNQVCKNKLGKEFRFRTEG